MPKNWSKVLLFIIILVLAGTLALKQQAAVSWSFDILLTAVLIPPLFLDFSELLFFEIFAVWFLRILYPFSGTEAIVLFLLPPASFVFKKIFPWRFWLAPFLVTLLGIFVFYLSANRVRLVLFSAKFLILDVAVSFAFAWVLCAFSGYFTKKNEIL